MPRIVHVILLHCYGHRFPSTDIPGDLTWPLISDDNKLSLEFWHQFRRNLTPTGVSQLSDLGSQLAKRHARESLSNIVVYSTFTQPTILSGISLLHGLSPRIAKRLILSPDQNFSLIERPRDYCPIIIVKYDHNYSKPNPRLIKSQIPEAYNGVVSKLYKMTDMDELYTAYSTKHLTDKDLITLEKVAENVHIAQTDNQPIIPNRKKK